MFSDKFNIETLQGKSNYHVWRDRVKAAFLIKNCSLAIEEENPDPKLCPAEKVGLALGIILSSVDRGLLSSVNEYKNPYLLWNALKKTYESEGINGIVGLYRQVITTSLNDCKDMDEYLSRFNDLFQKMRACGLKTENEILFPAMILGNLPEKFDALRMAFQVSEEKLTIEKVSRNLLEAYTGMTNEDSKKNALFSRGKKTSLKNSTKNCFNCNSTEHMWMNCNKPLKKSLQNRKKKNQKKPDDCNGKGNIVSFCARYEENSSATESETSQITANGDVAEFIETYSEASLKARDNVLGEDQITAMKNKNEFFIDSGASYHMTPFRDLLKNEKTVNGKITIADDSEINVVSSGDIEMCIGENVIRMANVLFVPQLGANLLSVSKLIANENKVVFEKKGCTIYEKSGKIVATCMAKNGMYKLKMDNNEKNCLLATNKQEDMMTWHRRLGHVNAQFLKKMKTAVDGVDFNDNDEASIKNCSVCAEGKQHALPFGTSTRKTTKILQLVHSDVCGPVETVSIGKNKYFMTLIDDYSRKVFVYFLERKNQAFDKFREFKAAVENELGEKIVCLRTDNGGEYVNTEFDKFLVKKRDTTRNHNCLHPGTKRCCRAGKSHNRRKGKMHVIRQ
jgi:hypothetical protein